MKCIEYVRKSCKPCHKQDCRKWIDYPDDLNCVLEAIKKNKDASMSLREVAKRLGVSFVRIKQIEDIALKKISVKNSQLFEYLLKDDF